MTRQSGKDKKKRTRKYEEDEKMRIQRSHTRGKKWVFEGCHPAINGRFKFTIENGGKTVHYADRSIDKCGGTVYQCLGGVFRRRKDGTMKEFYLDMEE